MSEPLTTDEAIQHVVAEAVWAAPPASAQTDGVPPTSYPARAEHTDPDFPTRDFAHGHGWGLPQISSEDLAINDE